MTGVGKKVNGICHHEALPVIMQHDVNTKQFRLLNDFKTAIY